MEIKDYWKLVIGTTFGICLLVFGLVFWDGATTDYTSHLIGKTYEITSCQQYLDFGSFRDSDAMANRDSCLQKKQLGAFFMIMGITSLWASIYIHRDYITNIMKTYELL